MLIFFFFIYNFIAPASARGPNSTIFLNLFFKFTISDKSTFKQLVLKPNCRKASLLIFDDFTALYYQVTLFNKPLFSSEANL